MVWLSGDEDFEEYHFAATGIVSLPEDCRVFSPNVTFIAEGFRHQYIQHLK